jgi:signal transduction histidine kinase
MKLPSKGRSVRAKKFPNLLGINHLLNRTLVYTILSISIFGLYLGPLLLLYWLLPGNILLQLVVISGLTLLVGWSFDWARTRVQRFVDRLFYGGWYDYPGVVETVSDALARSLEREEICAVLTQQVPELMQLRSCNLWIGESNATFPSAPPPHERFRFQFQSDVPAQWTVGPHQDGSDLSEADLRILNTLARQAEIALNNVLLVETLRRQLDELQASRQTLTQTQRQLLRSREEERARLSRELHDSPVQTLVSLNIQLGLLLAKASQDSPLRQPLSEMRAEVRELLSELRQICAELRPPLLDSLGLGAALRSLIDEWHQQYKIEAVLDLPADEKLRRLPDEVALNLYRVTQEALGNVARHASAQCVEISLTCEGEQRCMTIYDDGRGFDVPETLHNLPAQDHYGLVGMRERIELIGGTWSLESAPGQGTTVRVRWNNSRS